MEHSWRIFQIEVLQVIAYFPEALILIMTSLALAGGFYLQSTPFVKGDAGGWKFQMCVDMPAFS